MRQGIANNICFSLTVINSEMIPKAFLSPTDLLRTQVFGVHKLTKFVVVIFAAFQVMALSLIKAPNHEFYIRFQLELSFLKKRLFGQFRILQLD